MLRYYARKRHAEIMLKCYRGNWVSKTADDMVHEYMKS